MRNGNGSRRHGNGPKIGRVRRLVCRMERRFLGLGMRGIATFADRRLARYNARSS